MILHLTTVMEASGSTLRLALAILQVVRPDLPRGEHPQVTTRMEGVHE